MHRVGGHVPRRLAFAEGNWRFARHFEKKVFFSHFLSGSNKKCPLSLFSPPSKTLSLSLRLLVSLFFHPPPKPSLFLSACWSLSSSLSFSRACARERFEHLVRRVPNSRHCRPLGGSARSWWREKEKFLFSWSLPGEKWGEGKQAATSKGGNASEKGEERNRRGGSGRSRKQVVKVTAVGPEKEGGGGEKSVFLFGFWLALTISFSSPSPLRPPRHRRVLIALSPKMARSLLFVAVIAALTCAASAAPGE